MATESNKTPIDRTAWLAEQWAADLSAASNLESADDLFPRETRAVVERILLSVRGWQRLDSDGLCRWFSEVRRLTQEIYGDYRVQRASLEVGHIGRAPVSAAPVPDPYSLSATTRHDTDRAVVRLKFHLKGFGPATYAAILRVLVHECVAHVPSGHARPDRPGTADNTSPFAEGFMDFAAEYFTDRWADGIDSEMAGAVREHGARLRQILPHRHEAGGANLIGFRAGERLVDFFASKGHDRQRAHHDAVVLAVQLNGSGRPLCEKDHFVSRLYPPFPVELASALECWRAGTLTAEDVLVVAQKDVAGEGPSRHG